MVLKNNLADIYGYYLNSTRQHHKTIAVEAIQDSISQDSISAQIVPHYSIQSLFRPFYSKGNPQPPDIGDHPDFRYLKGTTEIVYYPITTMFMDMEGSTRLNLLYDPEVVRDIKNSFIRAAIEFIKTFDGHVHRIMGDAVMAYFGGINKDPKMGIIDAINCASLLCCFVEQGVRPYLQDYTGYDDPFGIRVGIDFGPKERVLWSAYGFPAMEEVTATSFYVDVASKLQHSAGRNQIMIGQSLQETLDFPMELLGIKTIQKNGEQEEEPFLKPNLTDREGNPINYKQYILKWRDYISFSPIPQNKNLLPKDENDLQIMPAILEVFNEETGSNLIPSCSLVLPKNKWLKFKVKLPYMPVLPYEIKATVENHGEDAKRKAGEKRGNHFKLYEINTPEKHNNFVHKEYTLYSGLHYLIIDIITRRGTEFRTKFAVYID